MRNINDKLNKMIKDTQEYLQYWEKENNPFYPSEMRWDRLQVNRFLKDYKQQLILPVVSNQRELLIAGFIKEIKYEFKYENWEYLDFIKDRYLSNL